MTERVSVCAEKRGITTRLEVGLDLQNGRGFLGNRADTDVQVVGLRTCVWDHGGDWSPIWWRMNGKFLRCLWTGRKLQCVRQKFKICRYE